jgi:glycosyltransferase involved in cell wall biosynthesis
VIGRIAPEKGQKVFLEAARLLPPARRCRFVICGAPLFGDPGGRAYHEEVRALAKGLPVEFTGQVEDSAEVLGGLDLLVAPSMTHEATTRVIPEAYAAGVAVVAFATGGIPEIVSDGETGWLVGERTAQALAGKLDSILASRREALRRTAEAGRERWRREFSLGLFQARMLAAMSCAARGAPFPEELETAARR